MKRFISHRIFSLLASLLVTVSFSTAFAQDIDDATLIRNVIAKAYDNPHYKSETGPIVVVNDYAIADWIHGEKSGRGLLRKAKGQWEIMACGGDGFKDIDLLKDAGLPKETAKNLIASLNKAEQSIDPERVKRFGLYGTSDNSNQADHHSHSKH